MASPLDDIQTNSPDLMITPPIPDDSNLPITSNAPPQSPTGAAMAQMQAGQQPQRSNQPPVPQLILQQLVSGMIKPPQTAPDAMGVTRPVSRVNVMENFLGSFVQALGAGLSASHGPGAFGKGFGAAVTAPYQQSLQQFQLGQQAQANQADIAQRQAQTQLTQAQAQQMANVVQTPYGPMSQALAAKVFPAAIQAQGKVQSAQIAGQSRIAVAQITNPSLPFDPQIANAIGRPELANQIVGKAAFDSYIKEFNAKTKLVGTTRTGEQLREDADGNIIKIPVTSTTRANLPTGATAGTQPTAAGVPGTGGSSTRGQLGAKVPRAFGGPQIVAQGKTPPMVQGTTEDGRQVAGTRSQVMAAGVPSNSITPLPATNQQQVITARTLISKDGLFDLIDQDLKAFKPEELDGIGNRLQEFLTGTFGADDRYVRLRTHVNGLAGTALMQAHVGSRGGEAMMEHFSDLANAKTFTYSNLKSALGAEQDYVRDRAMLPTKSTSGSGDRVDSVLRRLGL